MSNFTNLFPSYESNEAYMAALVKILEHDENNFFGSNPAAGTYGFLGTAYTIGYGYDISQQSSGLQIISDFQGSDIFTTSNTGIGGQYASLYTLLQNYEGSGNNSTTLKVLNAAFTSAFGTHGITQSQALALLNYILPRYASSLADTIDAGDAQQNGFTLGNNGLQLLLMTEWYNGQTAVVGPIQVGDIANDKVTDFLENVLFFNNTTGGIYSSGLQNRRMNDLATALGLATSTDANSGLTTLNFNSNLNSSNHVYTALDIAQALVQYSSATATHISSLAAGNDAASNLTDLDANLLLGAESALLSLGYYVPQTTNQTPPSAGYSLALLQRLNAPFADSSFAAGGLIHVPVASQSVSLTGTALYVIPKGQTYVFDTASGTLNTVCASLDGHDGGGNDTLAAGNDNRSMGLRLAA